MKNPSCDACDGLRAASSPAGDCAVATGAGLAAFFLFMLTLGPTITGEDSGEFVTAAVSLGIPHPPGYPLYCLLGHVFNWLPLGEAAWRVSLMSAVFAAGAVSLLAWTLLHLTRSRVAAFFGALVFAGSREFWAQAVVADVYALNLFLMAACFLLLLQWSETRRRRTLFLFALVFGLGFTLHNTFLLLAPPCVFYVLVQDHRAIKGGEGTWARSAATYLACVLIAACTLVLYLYLPLRSAANPPLDWGNPETLETVYRHIRRMQYDFMFTQYPRSAGRFLGQLAVYGHAWWREFAPGVALFGAAGLCLLLRRRRAYGALLVSSALLVIAGFSFWQNFERTREWLWVMRVFGIPAYYVTAVGIGAGLAMLARRGRYGQRAAIAAGIVMATGSVYMHYERNDKSSFYWTRDYGANILVSLEKDAIYVSESDHGSFSVLYLQTVFGMRPDVENLRKYGYLESGLFDEMPESLRTKIGPFPPRRFDPEIIAWLVDHTSRPVYLSKSMHLPTEQPVRIVPAGLTFRVLRPGESPPSCDYWKLYQWHTLSSADTRGDYTAETILCEIALAKAEGLLMTAGEGRSRHDEALALIEEGLTVYGRDPVMLNNAGLLCARYRLYPEAVLYFEEALKQLPHLSAPANNLEVVRKKINTIE